VWKFLLVLLFLGLAGWGASPWFIRGETETNEIFATARRASLPITVTERGDLESSKTTEVRCEVEGRQNKIVSILAEGTKVKKGQVVVTFDADELSRNYADQDVKWKQAEGKAKVNKGELEVQRNKAEQEIDKADLALKLAELDLEKYVEGDYKVEFDTDKSDIELAKKDLNEAKDKYEHMKKLVKQGFNSPEQLRLQALEVTKAEFTLSSKQAKLKVLEYYTKKRQETELKAKAKDAKRDLARAKSSGQAAIDKAQSDLDAAVAATTVEKHSLERLKKQVDNCQVKAPEDGIIVYSRDRWWDDSSRIQAGAMVYYQQGLFSLPDLTKMQMKVKVHEAVIKKVKVGQVAEIRLDALPKVLHGTVSRVGTLASSEGFFDRFVKEYETILTVDDLPADAGLKPGMSGEVKVFVTVLPDVLVIPVESVGQKDTHYWCYVRNGKGVERREITVGENNEKFVEVKSGLTEGEQVTLDARARVIADSKAEQSKPDDALQPVSPGQDPAQPAAVPTAQQPAAPAAKAVATTSKPT
jgi:RND family efflux transporter MFP subunit